MASMRYFGGLWMTFNEELQGQICACLQRTYTVEPQLSEPNGRHTIGSDNRGIQMDEGNRNLPYMGYQVGDNRRKIVLCIKYRRGWSLVE